MGNERVLFKSKNQLIIENRNEKPSGKNKISETKLILSSHLISQAQNYICVVTHDKINS